MQNYRQQMDKIIAELDHRPTLLLHSCCGPCSSACIELLAPHFDLTVFFYNPNILPEEEWAKRLETQKQLLETAPFAKDVHLVVPEREEQAFLSAVKGLESLPEGGARCTECFVVRLSKTAQYAQEQHFDYFTTTLTISPHKNAELINQLGQQLSEQYAVPWLPSDFKKQNGYLRSIELSKEYNLYRQNWCGCHLGENP